MSLDLRTTTLRVSIGILAHNEEASIGAMLEQLLDQTIVTNRDATIDHVEIVALPNGCTDETAAVIEQRFRSGPSRDGLAYRLVVRDQPGKSRTWNHYVHEASDPDADVFVFLDADIGLPQRDAIERTVHALVADPHATAAIDTILKSAAANGPRSIGERLSVLATKAARRQAAIAGSLYAIRAEVARAIWMPVGLAVEDGFVRAMVLTDRFTHDEDLQRIAIAADAHHTFDADSGLRSFLRHEQRLVVGTMLNIYLFEHLWERAADPDTGDIGAYVGERNRTDPSWFADLCRSRIESGGRWLIPLDTVAKRLLGLRRQPPLKKLAYFPIALAATVPQAIACALANRTLRRGEGLGFW